MLLELMEGVIKKVRKEEDATDPSKERSKEDEDRIKNESQRLETLMATQPPTTPAPARAGDERKDVCRIAESAVLYGARQAELIYQNLFRGGQLPTQEELTRLLRDSSGNVVDPVDAWLIIQDQQWPEYFYSTRSWADKYWHRTRKWPLTKSQMFDYLKADEIRYREAYMSSGLQMRLGLGNSPEQSSYPLYNMVLREQAKQQQNSPQADQVSYM